MALPVSTGVHLYSSTGAPRIFAGGWVQRVDFSADGRLVAAGAPNGRAAIWETDSGQLVQELEAPGMDAYLTDLKFAPEGEDLLVGYGSAGEMRLWRASAGEVLLIVPGMQGAFSPTGDTFLTQRFTDDPAQDKIIELYQRQDGALLHRWTGSHVAYTASGQVAVERGGLLRLMDPATGQTVLSFSARLAAFSPDDTLLAAAMGRVVELYDAASGRLLRSMDGFYAGIDELRFSPDSKTLAGSVRYCETPNCEFPSQMTVLWRVSDGELLAAVQDPDRIPWFTFHPDSQALVAAGMEGLQTISTSDGQVQREVEGYTPPVSALAVSPNGRWLAAVELDAAWLWDTTTGLLLGKYISPSGCGSTVSVSISPNGQLLALCGALFQVSDGQLLFNFEQRLNVSFAVSQVAFSPDSRRAAVGFTSGELFLWNAAEDRIERQLDGEGGAVTSLVFSEDGQTLVSVASIPDFQVQVWRVSDGQRIQSLANSLFHKAVLTHDGQTVAALIAQDDLDVFGTPAGLIQLWDLTVGRLQMELPTQAAISLAISPDGSLIASGESDGWLRLWNTQDSSLVAEYPGHTNQITAAAFTQDGMRLITASLDGSTLIWGLP
jgi:WD40 repeat protein